MPGRKYNSAEYRYGFNGKEKDDEGEFGSITNYDYGFRIYNPAIAKFLSVDPLTKSYPELTPYQFASNRPIDGIDLDGLEYMDTDYARIKITNGGLYFVVENMYSVYRKQIRSTWIGSFSILDQEFDELDPYAIAKYERITKSIRSRVAGEDPSAIPGSNNIIREYYKSNGDMNRGVPTIEGRPRPIYGIGISRRITPPIVGSKGGVGVGRTAGGLSALAIGIELLEGVKSHATFWQIAWEEDAFKETIQNLELATDDVGKALNQGDIIPTSLLTKEGLSAITSYVLGGKIDWFTNDRTFKENQNFISDVIETGNKIIKEFSSKREEYPK